MRAQEEAWLSPLAVRSFETRGRLVPEEPCGVRTPFQRDRDRLVHSKPFRRLKGKTQVFIDPEGDHYRTRMTHTLETTAISRVVARALRLNEDLVEAIGLGHDTGHTPFGHAGEQALDDALNAAFGRRFRHNEQSLAHRAAAEPHPRGLRRHPHAHGRAGAGDARGQDRPRRRPGRLHQPRHRRRDPVRDPRRGRAAHAPRSSCSARPARSASTVSSTTSSRPRRRRATSGRATRSARRCSRSARSCSTASTSAPRSGRSTAGRTTSSQAIFARLVDDPELPAARRGRAGRADHRLRLRHDRPLRARVRWRARNGADQGQERARRHRRVEHRRGRRAANVAAQELGHALHGALPVPRGALAELLGQLRPQPLPLLRLRQGRRRRHVRPRDRGPRLRRRDRVAGRAVPGPARVRGELAAGRRGAASAASACSRCSIRRRRSSSATSGKAPTGSPCARTSRAAVSARRSRRSSGSGLSPGSGLAAKAREKGFTAEELRAAGLTNQRGNDYFPPRLMFPLADARGRVIGFQARKLRDDDPLKGKYVNSPESELFKKSSVLYGLHLARPAIAKQDRAVVVEGNTDVIALRQAGFEPVVASMGTALTEQHLRELARLTKRLYLCFDADAAGEEATLRGHGAGARPGVRDPDRRAAARPGSGRCADGLRAAARPGRELPPLPRPARARARRRSPGGIRPGARDPRRRPEDSPERQEALRLVADRLDLPRETLSGIAPARGAAAAAPARA